MTKKISELLDAEGISNSILSNMVAVSRDGMCNSRFRSPGKLPEETTYPAVLEYLEQQTGTRLLWACKNDDSLFLEIIG